MTAAMPAPESPPDAGGAGPVAAILLEGEGTLYPPRFPQQVLLPYARRNLARFLGTHRDAPALVEALAQLRAIAPGAPPVETLEALMDKESRLAPLRVIQAMLWEHGFARGDLRTPLHPETSFLLRHWRKAEISLFACSAAGGELQRLLLRHTIEGDLTSFFGGFFDIRNGFDVIQDAASAKAGGRVLFLSCAEGMLDAAAQAGFATCQILHDQEEGSPRHESAAGLRAAAILGGLPL